MPLYEYDCEACGKSFEVLQKLDDPAPDACEYCSRGPVSKRMSKTGFILKGSGWYVTDFRGGATAKTGSTGGSESTSESAAPKTSDAAATEGKPASNTGKSGETKESATKASTTKTAAP